jgi:(+)-abscisic acid 8'-hydroxylase
MVTFLGISSLYFFTNGFISLVVVCVGRYGDPFGFSFMGKKITVVNSPEAIKFVLSTAHTSFPSGYTKQFFQLLGEGKFVMPSHHPYYRKVVLAAVSGDGLLNLLPFINSLAEKTVKSWESQTVVNTVEEMQKVVHYFLKDHLL